MPIHPPTRLHRHIPDFEHEQPELLGQTRCCNTSTTVQLRALSYQMHTIGHSSWFLPPPALLLAELHQTTGYQVAG